MRFPSLHYRTTIYTHNAINMKQKRWLPMTFVMEMRGRPSRIETGNFCNRTTTSTHTTSIFLYSSWALINLWLYVHTKCCVYLYKKKKNLSDAQRTELQAFLFHQIYIQWGRINRGLVWMRNRLSLGDVGVALFAYLLCDACCWFAPLRLTNRISRDRRITATYSSNESYYTVHTTTYCCA